jgi:hypothetical protein
MPCPPNCSLRFPGCHDQCEQHIIDRQKRLQVYEERKRISDHLYNLKEIKKNAIASFKKPIREKAY